MFLFDKVISSRLPQSDSSAFWNSYGVFLLVFVVIWVVSAFVFVPILFRKVKQKRESRMIDLNGKKVDSAKIVTITLMGSTFKFVQQFKGDIFIAPLQEKDGYEFAGWYYDTAFTKPYHNRPIKADITLYPKWVKHS